MNNMDLYIKKIFTHGKKHNSYAQKKQNIIIKKFKNIYNRQ